jgi:hypothetical protein
MTLKLEVAGQLASHGNPCGKPKAFIAGVLQLGQHE